MIRVSIVYKVHDYEVFRLDDNLFMIYSSNIDYSIRVSVLHNENKLVEKFSSVILPVELPIVHSFKCHVNAKNATEVTCAFASDGYRIQLITLVKEGTSLKEKSRRSLKMYKNLSGLKMDFDDKILAISGNLFYYNPTEVSFENKFMPGIAVYNLSDSSDLIAGHISSKQLGFNPSEHNHEIRVVQKHNISLIGVRGNSGAIDLFELKDPEIWFTKVDPDQFSKLRLVLTSYRTDYYDLRNLFHLEGQSSAKPPPTENGPPKKDKPEKEVIDTKNDLDVDTSIPDVEVPKHQKKTSDSHIYIVFAVILFGALAVYFLTRKKDENPTRPTYEMTASRDTHSGIGDSSMFDKTE